jgi:hypothetical protein
VSICDKKSSQKGTMSWDSIAEVFNRKERSRRRAETALWRAVENSKNFFLLCALCNLCG